jgi:hypothetical protein
MWAAIGRQWDYVAIVFVLGLYVTGALSLAISLILTLEASL